MKICVPTSFTIVLLGIYNDWKMTFLQKLPFVRVSLFLSILLYENLLLNGYILICIYKCKCLNLTLCVANIQNKICYTSLVSFFVKLYLMTAEEVSIEFIKRRITNFCDDINVHGTVNFYENVTMSIRVVFIFM